MMERNTLGCRERDQQIQLPVSLKQVFLWYLRSAADIIGGH